MSFHEENNNIYGHVAGVLTVSIMLPQLFHTWKIKSTRDLSMTMLIINQISGILWIIYALYTYNMVLFIYDTSASIISFIMICSKIYFDYYYTGNTGNTGNSLPY
jgi:MtN3 and saliva related transmembrane protein